jgi:hypothetical protein
LPDDEVTPRIVVFARGGLFLLQTTLVVPPHTSIFGQSAPKDSSGVTIALVPGDRQPVLQLSSNTVLRFLRVRRRWNDEESRNTQEDTTRCCGVAIKLIDDAQNIVLDHLSVSWGGTTLLKGSGVLHLAMTNSVVSDAFYDRSHTPLMLGSGIVLTQARNVTFAANLFFNGFRDWPDVEAITSVEVVNNAFVHTGSNLRVAPAESTHVVPTSRFNIVNNVFVDCSPQENGVSLGEQTGERSLRLYVEGNLGCARTSDTQDETDIVGGGTNSANLTEAMLTLVPNDFGTSTLDGTLAADAVLDWLLAEAGATLPVRDVVDAGVVQRINSPAAPSVVTNIEETGRSYGPSLPGTTWGTDADTDGIPDEEEVSLFGAAVDGAALAPGGEWSYLEYWLNSEQVLGAYYVPIDPPGVANTTSGSIDTSTTTPSTSSSGGPDAAGDSVVTDADGMSPLLIASLATSIVLVLAMIFIGVYCLGKRQGKRASSERSSNVSTTATSYRSDLTPVYGTEQYPGTESTHSSPSGSAQLSAPTSSEYTAMPAMRTHVYAMAPLRRRGEDDMDYENLGNLNVKSGPSLS